MREDIHIKVNLPELDGRAAEKGGLPKRQDALPDAKIYNIGQFPAGTPLTALKEKCKQRMAEQADLQAWEKMNDLFRHFWADGKFLPYNRRQNAPNTLDDVTKNSFITLTFARDAYMIRTPGGTSEWILDPEIPVRQVLENLHTAGKIDAVCCYDVFDHKGIALKLTDSLYSQGAWPHNGVDPDNKSRLEVRVKAEYRYRGWWMLLFLAILGFIIGFALRRSGWVA